MKDYYRILGVARTATADEIKQAYRRMASQHHPDRGGDTGRFQELQEAYSVLGDPQQRQTYDNPGVRININSGMPNFNFDDIFEMFGARFGHATQQQVRTWRVQLWIGLEDVLRGGPRIISLGNGVNATAEISIPVGIADGDSVRYHGIGPNGSDLVAIFRVRPDERWHRDGNNLMTSVIVDVWDLILGTTAAVILPDQRQVEVQVPARTQPSTVLRVRGLGIPVRNSQPGDLLCRVEARLPQDIPPDLVEAIRQHHRR